MAADTISQTQGTSGHAAPYGATASAPDRIVVSAGRRRPIAPYVKRALTAMLSLCLTLLFVTLDGRPAASQEPAVPGAEPAGLRPDDVERAIWLLDDLGLFFGSLSEQERNQFARENWTTAQGNYETASGRLAERFGRGQIRIAELEAGRQAAVQGKIITLDRDLDGAWPAGRITALRERGQDDWIPLSRLSAVLLRALAPTFDLDKWSWFQDHLRRTPAIARLPGDPDADAVAAVTGFGFLRDRYLLSTILAETAPRTALRQQWAGRRDGLDREAEAFFQRQSGGEGKPTPADLGRQWAEFTKSSLQLSTSWADRRTAPEVPSFGRVSDSDLPLLVQRAARPTNPLDRYALALPVSPLDPVAPEPAETDPAATESAATGAASNLAEAQRPLQEAADGTAEPVDAAPADIEQAGTSERPETASDPGENAGTVESSDRSPAAAEPLAEAGPTEGREPDAAASFPLPQLSGLEEKLEQAGPTVPATAQTTVAVPAPPATQAPDVPVAVVPGAGEAPASTADTAAEGAAPAEDPAAPAGDRSDPVEARETAQAPQIEATGTPEATQEAEEQGAVQNDQTRQPGNEQVARLSDRDATPQGSHLSVWIEGIGAEGMATLGLAILSFFALSLLMALWLRALFRSERTLEGGEQPIIVVVETERGRPVGGAYATAGAVPSGGDRGRAEFIPAPPEETPAYAPPPANEPDVWPSTAAAGVDVPDPAPPPSDAGGETARQPQAAASPPPPSAEPADQPIAPEPPEREVIDPTEADTAGEDSVQAAPARSPAGTMVGDDGVSEPAAADMTQGASPPPVRPVTEDVTTMAPEDKTADDVGSGETWPAAPTAPAATFEPTGTEPPRQDETGAPSDNQSGRDSDADSLPAVDDGAAQGTGSVPPDPAPVGPAETHDDTGPDPEPAAPDAIVEPNQIEEALVALRDGQDVAARELDPDRLQPPQPFATVVPPVTLGANPVTPSDPDTRSDDLADGAEGPPKDRAAAESEADPFDPRPAPEPPTAASPDGESTQNRLEPSSGPPDAPETSGEDPIPEDTPETESQSEDIAAGVVAPDTSTPSELDEVAVAETLAVSDRPEAPGEAPLPGIATPQADSLFKEIGNALRAGDMTAFHSKFGDLTLLPPDRVERILYSPGGEDFAVACRALGVDKLDFASLFLLVRKQCLGEERVAPHRFSRVLALYDEVETDAAEQVLDRWRTDPTYPGIRDRVQEGQSPLSG